MTEQIIPFRRGSRNTRGPLTVEITISADGKEITDELSPLERCVVAHVIAEQVGIILRMHGNVTWGHKIAASAHSTAVRQRNGVTSLEDDQELPDVELS